MSNTGFSQVTVHGGYEWYGKWGGAELLWVVILKSSIFRWLLVKDAQNRGSSYLYWIL